MQMWEFDVRVRQVLTELETKRTKQCYCQALYFNNPPKLMPDQTKRTLLKPSAQTGQCTRPTFIISPCLFLSLSQRNHKTHLHLITLCSMCSFSHTCYCCSPPTGHCVENEHSSFTWSTFPTKQHRPCKPRMLSTWSFGRPYFLRTWFSSNLVTQLVLN